MADPPRPAPPRPSTRPTPAPPLGKAEQTPDPTNVAPTSRRAGLGTVPLRPLIDIAQPRLTLDVEREAGQPVTRQLVHEGEICRIGTHPSNDLTLDDPAVSRFHCRLVPDKQGWKLEDSGSLNGTFLGDLRIHGAVLPAETTL